MTFNAEIRKIPGRVQNGLAGAPGFTPAQIIANVDISRLQLQYDDHCMAAQVCNTTFKAWAKEHKVSFDEAVEWGLMSPHFVDRDSNHVQTAQDEYYQALGVEWARQIQVLKAVLKPAEAKASERELEPA